MKNTIKNTHSLAMGYAYDFMTLNQQLEELQAHSHNQDSQLGLAA